MHDANTIRIEFDETDKRGRVVVAVRQGNTALAVETVNLLSGEQRKKFIERIRTDNPGLGDEFFERLQVELLRVAGDLVVSKGDEEKERVDPLEETPPEVKHAALAMLRDPNLIRHISDDIARLGVAGERLLAMSVYIIGTSRLLSRPLAGIVQGPTSSGKSFVIDEVGQMFPPEHVVRAHKMTPEALVHLPQGALVHKFVIAGERKRKQDDDSAEATRALREMLSDGKLTKLMPTKRAGQIVTICIEQPGPIAFVESTTHQTVFNEDRNRCLFMTTDETSDQTKRILESMAETSTSPAVLAMRESIVAKHHAAHRMLLCCKVKVPFARRLAALFPHQRTEARRGFGQLLSLIKAVALLHQFQRLDMHETGLEIEATRHDYEVARKLAGRMFGRSVDAGYTPAVQRFGERLIEWFGDAEFDTSVIATREMVIADLQTIRQYARVLMNVGILVQTEPARGQKPARYKIGRTDFDAAQTPDLPTADELFETVGENSHRVSASNDKPLQDEDLRRGSSDSASNCVSATTGVDEETRVDAET